MKTLNENLGWALAYLQKEEDITSAQKVGNPDYLEHIIRRYQELKGNGSLTGVLEALPEQPCLIDQSFLKNNEDFFIALFSNTKHDDACIRLYKHMNDCYQCFEIFSQVLRDYYQQGEVLHDFHRENQNG